MKKIAFLITFTFLIFTLNAQSDTISIYFRIIPEISAEYEILNRNLFPGVITIKQRDSLFNAFENYKIIVKKVKSKEERSKMPNGHYPYESKNLQTIGKTKYKELNANGLVKKYYQNFELENVVGRETINPYIYLYKEFYPNDSLKVKGLYTILDFRIGKWYYYDTIGNLINVIDTDEGYDFTAEDIIKFCIKEDVPLNRKYPSEYVAYTRINKTKKNDKLLWEITNITNGQLVKIVVDGKTGTVISRHKEFLTE